MTFSTLKIQNKVRRLPCGVAAALAVFQRFMETRLSEISGTCIYLNGVIITGATMDDHASRLGMVQYHLKDDNLRFSRRQRKFGVPEVSFLGHRVDVAGIHRTMVKVRTIVEALSTTSMQSLQAFLVLILFYDRFLQPRATVAIYVPATAEGFCLEFGVEALAGV